MDDHEIINERKKYAISAYHSAKSIVENIIRVESHPAKAEHNFSDAALASVSETVHSLLVNDKLDLANNLANPCRGHVDQLDQM